MSWTVEFLPTLLQNLKAVELEVARQVLNRIEKLGPNPLRSMKRLKGSDLFCLRVGDYRAFARVTASQRRLEFTTLRHRSNAYRT